MLFAQDPVSFRDTDRRAIFGGPCIAVMLQCALDIGGGIVVSFGFPDLSFGGFAITVAAGERVNISIGGGYEFVLAR